MATEIVNSYNIFIDTERDLNGQSDGDSILLSLNQTPITCSDNQYIRLTLQSFSMYKSFTNVNANNNIFRINNVADATFKDFPVALTPANYRSRNDLAKEFHSKFSSALATKYNLTVEPLVQSTVLPSNSSTVSDNIIQFRIDFTSAHGLTDDLKIRFLVEDGDIFELLGGDRIRPGDPEDKASINLNMAPSTATDPTRSIEVTCKYNSQLSTQQNVYLRADINNTNIETESFSSLNTDKQGSNNLSSSRILARMIIDNEFVNFTTSTANEYFLNLTTKNLTFLRLYITDSHGRSIPQGVRYTLTNSTNTPVETPAKQLTLGNRSWEGVIKVDIVQLMGGHNHLFQGPPLQYTTAARFSTEPLDKLDYGASNYRDKTYKKPK